MPREIKFRAWDALCNNGAGKMFSFEEIISSPNENLLKELICSNDPDSFLMQYTGLKASNGEIYEGHIIEVEHFSEYESEKVRGVVAWGSGEWVLKRNKDDDYPMEIWNDGEHEWHGIAALIDDTTVILGNVHQNPELLTGKSNGS